METQNPQDYRSEKFRREEAYLRAEKRLKELKGFYWHAFWYIVVNVFIICMIVFNGGDFFSFGTFATPLFWGIGLAFHAMTVFGVDLLFGKAWEERKIKEYMDKERQNF
ncbi:2TM domain-containing protein [Pseudotamlana agarivorans]|uniref:2TM domain-containing protein n=1 Tax=Pseudotamlana agarivorans TaxID=481183 RepID=UPI000835B13F|nr:2TM domain-containing protein [Tamlana agarivorans]